MTAKAKIILLGTAVAVLIAVAAASVVLWQYGAIDRQASTHALDTAQSVHKYVQEQRVAHLEEASRTIATNPSFVSYIAQALSTNDGHGAIDVASIRDLLDERRHDAGLDAAAILDASGKAVASVGDTLSSERDWSALSVVAQVKKNPAQARLDDHGNAVDARHGHRGVAADWRAHQRDRNQESWANRPV